MYIISLTYIAQKRKKINKKENSKKKKVKFYSLKVYHDQFKIYRSRLLLSFISLSNLTNLPLSPRLTTAR